MRVAEVKAKVGSGSDGGISRREGRHLSVMREVFTDRAIRLDWVLVA